MVWDIELLERRCSMTMNFRLLASSSPPSNITIETVPHEPGADELTGGSSAWMGKINVFQTKLGFSKVAFIRRI
jgi:hypothetical protein